MESLDGWSIATWMAFDERGKSCDIGNILGGFCPTGVAPAAAALLLAVIDKAGGFEGVAGELVVVFFAVDKAERGGCLDADTTKHGQIEITRPRNNKIERQRATKSARLQEAVKPSQVDGKSMKR